MQTKVFLEDAQLSGLIKNKSQCLIALKYTKSLHFKTTLVSKNGNWNTVVSIKA